MADDNSIVTEINPVRRQVLRGAIAAATVAGVSSLVAAAAVCRCSEA